MSLKKVEQVKKDKGFKIFDLIIYGAVLLIVSLIFIVVFVTQNDDPLTGVRVYVEGEQVLEYEFGGEYVIADGVETVTAEEDGSGITVTVHTGEDLNVIYIDKSAKTVKMTEANCKGKQCLYFPEMSKNTDFIYCSPHGVKIEPLTRNYDSPDIIM